MSCFPTFADFLDLLNSCDHLRQRDIDNFLDAGVPVMALTGDPGSTGFCLSATAVVFEGDRFELSEDMPDRPATRAYILPVLDIEFRLIDLCAFRPRESMQATWLGRASLLGEYNAPFALRDGPLHIHSTVLDWLRADRSGVVVLDPVMAAGTLRLAGPIAAPDWAVAAQLHDSLTTPPPKILVPVEA